jgi:hypothetical protein
MKRTFPTVILILGALASLALGLGCLEPQHGNYLEHAPEQVPGPGTPKTPPVDPDYHPD